jgi:hypothetical protein
MPEQNKPFVITDRRKFTLDGEPRPDADVREDEEREQTRAPEPVAAAAPAQPAPVEQAASESGEPTLPPPPTAEETEQAKRAYDMTADHLDTAIRSANPGADHPPAINFDQLVQSLYLTAIMQLGGATREGQQPQIDIIGARQSIDMLGVLQEKTKGNLTPEETRLLDSALFELRLAFLEVTQAVARSAAAKAGAPGQPSRPGPGVVR